MYRAAYIFPLVGLFGSLFQRKSHFRPPSPSAHVKNQLDVAQKFMERSSMA